MPRTKAGCAPTLYVKINPMKESPEKRGVCSDIYEAGNFTDLYDYFEDIYKNDPETFEKFSFNIEENDGQSRLEALIQTIEAVRKGELDPGGLTNSFKGLRSIVMNLREKELIEDARNMSKPIKSELHKHLADSEKKELKGLETFGELYSYLRTKDTNYIKKLGFNIDREDAEDIDAEDLIWQIEEVRLGHQPIETLSDDLASAVIELMKGANLKSKGEKIDEIQKELTSLHKSFDYRKAIEYKSKNKPGFVTNEEPLREESSKSVAPNKAEAKKPNFLTRLWGFLAR